MSQTLHELYLDALVSARPVLGDQVRDVYLQTGTLVESSEIIRIYEITPHPVPFHTTKFDVKVRSLVHLPPIESREILLRLIVGLHKRINYKSESRGYQELCDTLGCLVDRTHNVAERWRKLSILRPSNELSYAGLESRPACKICGGIVATGAGWQPDAFSAPPLSARNNASGMLDRDMSYRADVHHECKRYATEIMLPALRAQRERAAALASKEIDK